MTADPDCDCSIAYVVKNHAEKDDGALTCWIWPHSMYERALDLDLHAPANSPVSNGRKAELSFANVECVFRASGANAEQQVSRFPNAARQKAAS